MKPIIIQDIPFIFSHSTISRSLTPNPYYTIKLLSHLHRRDCTTETRFQTYFLSSFGKLLDCLIYQNVRTSCPISGHTDLVLFYLSEHSTSVSLSVLDLLYPRHLVLFLKPKTKNQYSPIPSGILKNSSYNCIILNSQII